MVPLVTMEKLGITACDKAHCHHDGIVGSTGKYLNMVMQISF